MSTSTTRTTPASDSIPHSLYLDNASCVFPYIIDYSDPQLLNQGLRDVVREIVPGWAALIPVQPPSSASSDADITIAVISGGITNLLYRLALPSTCTLASPHTPRDVIVRIYGRNTEVIIDREKENRLFAALSAVQYAPTYWGRFTNGRVEGWLDARPLNPEELAMTGQRKGNGGTPVDFMGMIAREMARLHALQIEVDDEGGQAKEEEEEEMGKRKRNGGGGRKAVVWDKMEEWARLAKNISFEGPDGQEGGTEKQRQLEAIGLNNLEKEMEWLKDKLVGEEGEGGVERGRERSGQEAARYFLAELVFSHQDVLCGNILYNPMWRRREVEGVWEGAKGGSEGQDADARRGTGKSAQQVSALEDGGESETTGAAIVGEATSGPAEEGRVQFIDFEYGGWNHRGFDLGNHFCEYAGYNPDYEASYPSRAQQEWFFKAYLDACRWQVGGKEMEEKEENAFLEGLYIWVNRYACAAHLFWGYWAIIQAKYSPIDFDFLLYASQRLTGYAAFKQRFF